MNMYENLFVVIGSLSFKALLIIVIKDIKILRIQCGRMLVIYM